VSDLISIIATTFDRADALDAVLRSLSRQDDRQFEVVIADDGSALETAELIEKWKPRLGVPLAHVWQEHRGFRAAEIRNRALRSSRGSYCIFLDGDCLVRPDFVASHRGLAEPGRFVTGNRALLSQALTEETLRGPLEIERWGLAEWIHQRLAGGLNRLPPVLRLPLGPLRKLRSHAWQGARSCNLAVWRSDLDRVDGFDASFSGWGREDSDLLVRLLHAGVRRKEGRFATGVLHLWHPDADRSALSTNEQRLADVIASRRARAERGISTLAPDALPSRMPAPAVTSHARMPRPGIQR
jgi:glycosyltransferase involved in cell wall biosynthesis